MNEPRLLDELGRMLRSAEGREAKRIAETIRSAGDYRWVGIYEVSGEEIAVIGWSGPGEPAHARFPITQGLSGTAVSSGETVVVVDVTTDLRYLTAFGSTRSEIVVPVIEPATRKVVGTIDVASIRTRSRMPTAPPWSAVRRPSLTSSWSEAPGRDPHRRAS